MKQPQRKDFEITHWISNGKVIANKDYKGLHVNQEYTTVTTVEDLDQIAGIKNTHHDEKSYQKAKAIWDIKQPKENHE